MGRGVQEFRTANGRIGVWACRRKWTESTQWTKWTGVDAIAERRDVHYVHVSPYGVATPDSWILAPGSCSRTLATP